MRSVCIVLGLVVALGNSLQETPEDNDGQCLLSKKRVARMPNVDMLASSVHSKARAQHTSVLQKGAERSDPLDRIDWDQQLHEYRMVADDVAPVDKKNRCPLRRMDAQKVRDEELDNLDKPAILTNVFDPNEHWTSDLSKVGLCKVGRQAGQISELVRRPSCLTATETLSCMIRPSTIWVPVPSSGTISMMWKPLRMLPKPTSPAT